MCSDWLKLKIFLILTCKTKTLGFQNLWSTHSVVSKLCLKSLEKYESLLDLAFLKVYPAKFYQGSDYRLSRASSLWNYSFKNAECSLKVADQILQQNNER